MNNHTTYCSRDYNNESLISNPYTAIRSLYIMLTPY